MLLQILFDDFHIHPKVLRLLQLSLGLVAEICLVPERALHTTSRSLAQCVHMCLSDFADKMLGFVTQESIRVEYGGLVKCFPAPDVHTKYSLLTLSSKHVFSSAP